MSGGAQCIATGCGFATTRVSLSILICYLFSVSFFLLFIFLETVLGRHRGFDYVIKAVQF